MNYLMNYKGKYRIKVPYDLNTNDFSKKLNGNYEDIDIYISCSNGIKVFYAGKGLLYIYIPSLKRGHNILKQLYYENINPENVRAIRKTILRNNKKVVKITYNIIDKKLYESELKTSKFIYDICELDSEVTFKIHKKNSDKIIPLLKPKTSGADISPFSSKNLPKIEYLIPKDELREYEDIIAPLKEDGKLLVLSKLTQNYIKLLSKKRLYRGVDMKTYMRKKMLKGKEFIHSEGHWNDYLKYLREEIPNA